MGPVNFLSAKKETPTDVKLDKKDQQIETTMKTNEGQEPDNNDTMKIESSKGKPTEKGETTTTEGSDYFLNQNNPE